MNRFPQKYFLYSWLKKLGHCKCGIQEQIFSLAFMFFFTFLESWLFVVCLVVSTRRGNSCRTIYLTTDLTVSQGQGQWMIKKSLSRTNLFPKVLISRFCFWYLIDFPFRLVTTYFLMLLSIFHNNISRAGNSLIRS